MDGNAIMAAIIAAGIVSGLLAVAVLMIGSTIRASSHYDRRPRRKDRPQ